MQRIPSSLLSSRLQAAFLLTHQLALASLVVGLSSACPTPNGDDAGNPDADSGIDSGNPDDNDAGDIVADAGEPDPEEDAGINPDPDAGEPVGDCDERTGVLGGFALGADFQLIEEANLPAPFSNVATLIRDDGQGGIVRLVLALDLASGSVAGLGEWPALGGEGSLPLLPPDADPETTIFPSSFLAPNASGTLVAAGYTEPGNFESVPGTISLFTTDENSSSDTATFINAPGNFGAAYLGDDLIVNGLGLDDVGAGTGLYALLDGDTPAQVGEFPADLSAFSGLAASNDVGVLAYAGFYDGLNQIHIVSRDKLLDSNVINGAPLDLSAEPLLDSGTFYISITGYRDDKASGASSGFIVVRADFDDNFLPVFADASYIPVNVLETAPPTLTTGTPKTLITEEVSGCSSLLFTADAGDGVFIGISDKDGSNPRMVLVQSR